MVSFVSAGASGIALLLGIFLLQESNPRVLAKRGVKDVELVEVESGEGVRVMEAKGGNSVNAANASAANVNAANASAANASAADASTADATPTKATPTKATNPADDTTSTKPSRPKITKLMILCFVHEFCIRWTAMAYNSRYNIYITDRWNVSSSVFSFALPAAPHE